jgi:hypothetical protein
MLLSSVAQQPNSILNRLIVEVSRSYNYDTYTTGRTLKHVISSSQRPLPTQQTDIYAVSEIRTRDPSHQVVAQCTATAIG